MPLWYELRYLQRIRFNIKIGYNRENRFSVLSQFTVNSFGSFENTEILTSLCLMACAVTFINFLQLQT